MDRRPLVFTWRHFEPIILCAVRWYLRFSLSYREIQELLAERGFAVDHSTIWRWVQRFAPELNFRLRPHLKPTNLSWRVDETYVRVKASGVTCIVPSTRAAQPSNSSCRPFGIWMPPRACSGERCAMVLIASRG